MNFFQKLQDQLTKLMSRLKKKPQPQTQPQPPMPPQPAQTAPEAPIPPAVVPPQPEPQVQAPTAPTAPPFSLAPVAPPDSLPPQPVAGSSLTLDGLTFTGQTQLDQYVRDKAQFGQDIAKEAKLCQDKGIGTTAMFLSMIGYRGGDSGFRKDQPQGPAMTPEQYRLSMYNDLHATHPELAKYFPNWEEFRNNGSTFESAISFAQRAKYAAEHPVATPVPVQDAGEPLYRAIAYSRTSEEKAAASAQALAFFGGDQNKMNEWLNYCVYVLKR